MRGLTFQAIAAEGRQAALPAATALAMGLALLMRWVCFALLMSALYLAMASQLFAAPDPAQIIRSAYHHWRGTTSYLELSMVIHRPDWERHMALASWTRGEQDALIRFLAPPKDAGNATLKQGQAMWMYSPKLNQVIKLPTSMMAQSWMGSDFSYNDLAKSDQLLHVYDHRLLGVEQVDGLSVFTIESTPHADAPVVWGKEILEIREDHVLISEQFFDQAMVKVKEMRTLKIAELGGRPYPVLMQMTHQETPERWTRVEALSGSFDLSLPAYLFTQSNLRHPRPWSVP